MWISDVTTCPSWLPWHRPAPRPVHQVPPIYTRVYSINSSCRAAPRGGAGDLRTWKAGTMSERRQQVLDVIQRAAEPVGVSEIAHRIGVHPNTVRFHLEALVRDGIVERVPDTPSGPGRPRAGYRPRPGLARGSARRYRTLAEILLSHVAATSPTGGGRDRRRSDMG